MRIYKEQNQIVSGLQVINLIVKKSVLFMASFSPFLNSIFKCTNDFHIVSNFLDKGK